MIPKWRAARGVARDNLDLFRPSRTSSPKLHFGVYAIIVVADLEAGLGRAGDHMRVIMIMRRARDGRGAPRMHIWGLVHGS